jgi:hypothetical protein
VYDAILSLVNNLSEFLNGPTESEDLEANIPKDPKDNTTLKDINKNENITPQKSHIILVDLDGLRKEKVRKDITNYNTGKENRNQEKPLKRLDNRKPLLSNLAISKHIDPNCQSDFYAERKSIEQSTPKTLILTSSMDV